MGGEYASNLAVDLTSGALEVGANAGDGFIHRGAFRHFQAEIAGDGVDFGGVERNAAAVDGENQLLRPGKLWRQGFSDENLAKVLEIKHDGGIHENVRQNECANRMVANPGGGFVSDASREISVASNGESPAPGGVRGFQTAIQSGGEEARAVRLMSVSACAQNIAGGGSIQVTVCNSG